MDPTASIITILATSWKLIEYVKSVRDGKKERSYLTNEVTTLHKVFQDLQEDLNAHKLDDGSTWSEAIGPLFNQGGEVDQMKTVLVEITARIGLPVDQPFKTAARRLRWPFDKADVQRLAEHLRSLRDTIDSARTRANLGYGEDTNAKTLHLSEALKRNHYEATLQHISTLDFRTAQRSEQKRPLSGTGNWFLRSPQVKGWSETRTPILWCHGIPGAGKTMLASAAFQALQDHYGSADAVVTVAFCSFDDQSTHTAYGILSALLRQVVEARGELSDKIRTMFDDGLKGTKPAIPDIDHLCSVLGSEFSSFPKRFIVLDGLDEMPEHTQRSELLSRLESMTPMASVMVASRPLPEIVTWFKKEASESKYKVSADIGTHGSEYEQSTYSCDNCDDTQGNEEDDDPTSEESLCELDDWTTFASYRCSNAGCQRDVCVRCFDRFDNCFGCNEPKRCFVWAWPGSVAIEAHPEDLAQYIAWRIQSSAVLRRTVELAHSKGHDLQHEIVDSVERSANKMFLLAKFHMDALADQTTAFEVRSRLRGLPTEIDEIYRAVFRRIKTSAIADKIQRFILIVATAQRLLSVAALEHAIAVQSGEEDISWDNIADGRTLASMCAGLVEIDSFDFVRLAHETVGFFILTDASSHLGDGEDIMADVCLTYLQFRPFLTGAFNDNYRTRRIEERKAEFPFLEYAALHWGDHARLAQDPRIPTQIRSFLRQDMHVQAAVQIMWMDDVETSSGWDAEFGVSALHLAAYFGLVEVASELMAVTTEVDVEDCLGTTPLMYGECKANCSAENVEQSLTEPCGIGTAATGGHLKMIQLLLRERADPGRICRRGRSALHRVCHAGALSLFETLVRLPQDIAVNAPDKRYYDQTALTWAIGFEDDSTLKTILARRDVEVAVGMTPFYGHNALTLACANGNYAAVQIILDDGRVPINTATGFGTTALIVAAEHDFDEIVELLLQHGADPNVRDSLGGTALLRAVDGSCFSVVKILVDRGVDCMFRDDLGRGVLHGCAINRRARCMQYLLENAKSLDVNIQDDDGKTPLHDAVSVMSEFTIKVLLQFGARTDVRDNRGRTPLRLARESDQPSLLALLIAARDSETAKIDMTSDQMNRFPRRHSTLGLDFEISLGVCAQKMDRDQFEVELRKRCLLDPAVVNEPSADFHKTALHIAAKYGREDNVNLLLDHDADINLQDTWGWTPLHVAVQYERVSIVTCLLEKGSAVDLLDRQGRTPLALAVQGLPRPWCAIPLLQHGASCKNLESWLVSVLSYAVDSGDFDTVRLLVEGGVPIYVRDSDRKTPYQRAKAAGSTRIADYLLLQLGQDRQRHVSVPTKMGENRMLTQPLPDSTQTLAPKTSISTAPSADSDDMSPGLHPIKLLEPVETEVPGTQLLQSMQTQIDYSIGLAKQWQTRVDISTREIWLILSILCLLAALLLR